jgi:hypothetical protein
MFKLNRIYVINGLFMALYEYVKISALVIALQDGYESRYLSRYSDWLESKY